MDKEYLMLRSEIEENLKKQDQVFGIVISILGLTNIFSHVNITVRQSRQSGVARSTCPD